MMKFLQLAASLLAYSTVGKQKNHQPGSVQAFLIILPAAAAN